jgi:hypothetical protein
MGPPALLPIRRKVCCRFLSPLKSIALAGFETATFGFSSVAVMQECTMSLTLVFAHTLGTGYKFQRTVHVLLCMIMLCCYLKISWRKLWMRFFKAWDKPIRDTFHSLTNFMHKQSFTYGRSLKSEEANQDGGSQELYKEHCCPQDV